MSPNGQDDSPIIVHRRRCYQQDSRNGCRHSLGSHACLPRSRRDTLRDHGTCHVWAVSVKRHQTQSSLGGRKRTGTLPGYNMRSSHPAGTQGPSYFTSYCNPPAYAHPSSHCMPFRRVCASETVSISTYQFHIPGVPDQARSSIHLCYIQFPIRSTFQPVLWANLLDVFGEVGFYCSNSNTKPGCTASCLQGLRTRTLDNVRLPQTF
jgi:hypothetical protein